jgi:tetratricopeptide (TPR) repeat protein
MGKLEFAKARKLYKRCIKVTPTPDEQYFIKAQIGISHQLQGHLLRALFTYFDLEKLIPNRWETKRLIAGVYMQKAQYKKALPYLTFALEGNEKQYLYGLFGYDLAELWDLIASCYQEVDEPERAVIAFSEAIKHAKTEEQKGFYKTKMALSQMLAKNPNATIDVQEFNKIANS